MRLCIDEADGTVVWNVEVFQPDAAVAKQMHSKNSPASSTPVVDGDRLYVHFGHHGHRCRSTSTEMSSGGKQSLNYEPRHGNGGSPVMVDGALVFSCDAAEDPFVAVLEAESATSVGKTDRNTSAKKTFSFSTPTVIDIKGAARRSSAQAVECWRRTRRGMAKKSGESATVKAIRLCRDLCLPRVWFSSAQASIGRFS